jgi:uncharacterized protein
MNAIRPAPLSALWRGAGLAAAGLILVVALIGGGPAHAAPKFPPLTGRVVDDANVLSAATEAKLTEDLAALEASTGRQMVVATVPDLQGYEIEDFGYQLGRAWKLGDKERDDGALFLIAPSERKVRIEVGYGLEPVLTDALSSVILQQRVLPRFKAGDMEGGIVAGTEAIVQQLALPEGEAKAKVAQAQPARAGKGGSGIGAIITVLIILWVLGAILRGFGGRRRGGLWWLLPLLISSSGRGGGGGRSTWGGGGSSWGGGGGGFSGGGGSFGGGGSSGSW